MDPERRSRQQVTIEAPISADQIFTMLMDDQVGQRSELIEINALNASNFHV